MMNVTVPPITTRTGKPIRIIDGEEHVQNVFGTWVRRNPFRSTRSSAPHAAALDRRNVVLMPAAPPTPAPRVPTAAERVASYERKAREDAAAAMARARAAIEAEEREKDAAVARILAHVPRRRRTRRG